MSSLVPNGIEFPPDPEFACGGHGAYSTVGDYARFIRAYEAEGAGVLFPIRILTDLVVHLASRGVRFHAGARVDAVDPEDTATIAGLAHLRRE